MGYLEKCWSHDIQIYALKKVHVKEAEDALIRVCALNYVWAINMKQQYINSLSLAKKDLENHRQKMINKYGPYACKVLD